MDKKYELLDSDQIQIGNKTLSRIRALRNFANIKKGDLGGYVEKESNLSQFDNAWVYDNAKVYDGAEIYDDAKICGDARVYGFAEVSDEALVSCRAQIYDSAEIYGEAQVSDEACICGYAWVSGEAHVSGKAKISTIDDIISISPIGSGSGTLTAYRTDTGIEVIRGCFRGCLDEFADAVKKRHGNNKYGRVYKKAIKMLKEYFRSD